MTTHNPIDDLFSKGLSGYSEQPPAEVWNGVEKKLRVRGMWRRGFFLAAVLVVLISIVTGVYLNNQSHTAYQQGQKTQYQNRPVTENGVSETPISNPKTTTAPASSVTSDKTTAEPVQKAQATSQASHTTTTLNDDNNKNKIAEASKNVVAENNTPAAENPAPITYALTPASEKLMPRPIVEVSSIQEPETPATSISAPPDVAVNAVTGQTVITEKPVEKTENTQEEVVPAIVNPAEKNITPPTDSLYTAASEENTPALPAVPPATNYSPYKPRFEVLFYAMPSLVSGSYSGLTDKEKTFRNDHESHPLFVNYGMEFHCTLKNITIQTGIIQRQLGEKYRYDYAFVQNIDTTAGYYNVVITSHPDTANPGNTIITFDSSWVSVSDTNSASMKLNHLNVYKYMEVPLSIGYVFNRDRHQLGVAGGVSLGLLSYASSGLLNTSANEITPLSSESTHLQKMVWSYNMSLHYGYHISGQTTLFIQAAYLKNINGILRNTPFNVLYRSVDAKIGVMFKL